MNFVFLFINVIIDNAGLTWSSVWIRQTVSRSEILKVRYIGIFELYISPIPVSEHIPDISGISILSKTDHFVSREMCLICFWITQPFNVLAINTKILEGTLNWETEWQSYPPIASRRLVLIKTLVHSFQQITSRAKTIAGWRWSHVKIRGKFVKKS